MKKYLLFAIFMLVMSVVNGQSQLPISIGEKTNPFLLVTPDSVIIDAFIPITMNAINYRVHQYDEVIKVHYWGFGYRSSNQCSTMDQEFQLWMHEDSKEWYYSYTDYCVGYSVFEGDSYLVYKFRSTTQIPYNYDFKAGK